MKRREPSKVIAKDKNAETPTTARQTLSEKPASGGMPSKEILLASNNIEVSKPTKVSTAKNYQSWDLKIQGNKLLLTIKGEKTPTVVRTEDNPEKLKAIQRLFKPVDIEGNDVGAYETEQGINGNCGFLANLQEIMLNPKLKNSLIALIKAVDYNPKDQSWSMTYYDNHDKRRTYSLPKKAFSSIPPPMSTETLNKKLGPLPEGAIPFNPNELPTGQTPLTPEELKKLGPLPEGAIPFNPDQLPTVQIPLKPEKLEALKVAYSPTHQALNTLLDGTFRPFVYDNLEESEKKGRTPTDAKNIEGSTGMLPDALNPSVKRTGKGLTVDQGRVVNQLHPSAIPRPFEPFTLKQLAQLRKNNPNTH